MAGQRKRNAASFPTFCGRIRRPRVPAARFGPSPAASSEPAAARVGWV